MIHRIAVIDDETKHIEFYVSALSAMGFNVVHYKSPASCLTALEKGERFSLYLTDLMMPAYNAYTKSDTYDGLITGALLVRDIRVQEDKAPIILFTNMNVDSVLDRTQDILIPLPNSFLLRKSAYDPQEMAKVIHALLIDGESPEKRKGILRRFWDSLCLLYTSPSPRDRQKSRMPSSA